MVELSLHLVYWCLNLHDVLQPEEKLIFNQMQTSVALMALVNLAVYFSKTIKRKDKTALILNVVLLCVCGVTCVVNYFQITGRWAALAASVALTLIVVVSGIAFAITASIRMY